MKKIDPKNIEKLEPCKRKYQWTHTKPSPLEEARASFYNAYNWVACVARGLPGASFEEGSRVRDGKTRIIVRYQGERYECVVQDDDPTMVVRTFKDKQPRPYS